MEDGLSRTTVHTWFKQFKKGRDSTEDDKMCEKNADCFLRLKRTHTPWMCSIWPDSQCMFYLSGLKQLVACICRIRVEYHEPGSWYLLYDNAKPRTTHIIQQYFAKNQITVLNHPLCSQDFRKSNWKWREHFFRMWTRFRRWRRVISRQFLSMSTRTASNHCITILRTVSHVARIMLKPSIVS